MNTHLDKFAILASSISFLFICICVLVRMIQRAGKARRLPHKVIALLTTAEWKRKEIQPAKALYSWKLLSWSLNESIPTGYTKRNETRPLSIVSHRFAFGLTYLPRRNYINSSHNSIVFAASSWVFRRILTDRFDSSNSAHQQQQQQCLFTSV